MSSPSSPNAVPPIEPTPLAGPVAQPAVPPTPPTPGQVAPYAQASPYTATPSAYYSQAPYNTLAIVGFVLAFFVSLAAIVCGHIALSQIKRTGERGHGLALAAVIIGYVGLALGLLYAAVLIVFVIAEASDISY